MVFACAGVLAAAYGVWFCHQPESTLRSAIKTASVLLLALVALRQDGPPALILALSLSALGDFFLSRHGRRVFLAGLISFACAHLAYVVLFFGLGHRAPSIGAVIALFLFAAATEWWLAPFTDQLRWPVRIYVVLITAMGLASFTLPPGLDWVRMGALAFMASDTLLAIQLFRMPPQSQWHLIVSPLLWSLYWCAQAMIAWAVLG